MVDNEFTKALVRLAAKHSKCPSRPGGCVFAATDGLPIVSGYSGSPVGELDCSECGCTIEDGVCVRSMGPVENAILIAAREGYKISGSVLFVSDEVVLTEREEMWIRQMGVIHG